MNGDRAQQSGPLEVKQLCAWHESTRGNDGLRPEVFWGVSFNVQPGEIVGIVGPNGTGKTTLIRAVIGLHEFSTGQVVIDGIDVRSKRRAFIPQDYRESFLPWTSILRNLTLFESDSRSSRKRREHARDLLGDFGIDFDISLRPPQCSGGMVQQAAVVRAFMRNPDLLCGDEPFSALDVQVAARIREAFRRRVRESGIRCILVMHDIESVVHMCDRVLVAPGKPYSTEEGTSFYRATMFNNRAPARGTAGDIATGVNYGEIFREILEPAPAG
jgi:ABC-type nitrate/sulfonate/bicarbonate transport system ATPase subunit